jgi:hypothetical protein
MLRPLTVVDRIVEVPVFTAPDAELSVNAPFGSPKLGWLKILLASARTKK